jgi:predicted acyl esterase
LEEVLSAMAVIRWLNGEAKGYTTRRGNVEVKADWANGHVAMTGTSYPADISFATVVTGVNGLKAVMPQCNGLNWYDYYRYAGALNSPGGYGGEDMNLHASFNFSRFNADVTSGVPPANGTWFPKAVQDAFFETQSHMMEVFDRKTGDYNTEWELRNFGRLVENINEDVGLLMTTGFMDWNSQPKLSMANWTVLLDKCPGTFREFASISSHAGQNAAVIHGKSMVEWWHLWMDHFLLGLENNVVESLPDITVINTKTGAAEGYNVNHNAKPEDRDYLVRGGIVPGAKNQQLYMVPAQNGKAGRLSYNAPPDTLEHLRDLDIIEQLDHTTLYPGATALSTSYSSGGSTWNLRTTVPISSDGNRRVTNYDNNGSNAANQQALFCEGRAVGVNRTYNFGVTGTTPADIQNINNQIFAAVDKPIEGRLMYLSEPLEADVRLSGTGVMHLLAAPDRGVGNLSAAVVDIGRVRNMEYSRADAWGMSVGTGNNLLSAASYTLPYGGGISGNISIGTFRNPSQVGTFMNYKYVTVGYADVQNPDPAGKAWFEVPEQNYIPNFYFQTTRIVPGQYYPYTIEFDPDDYIFQKGSQIGVMIFGTDPDYSELYDKDCTAEFDIKIAESYVTLPLIIDEPYDPVTIEVGSAVVLAGDSAEVAYGIKDNSYGFTSFDFDLPFNSTAYTSAVVSPGALLSGGSLGYTVSGNVLNITFEADANVVGDGELFTVTYTADADAYSVYTPLNVKVNSLKYASLIDKLVDVKATVKAGALSTCDYNVYMVARPAAVKPGETLFVDVMLRGGVNYTSITADINYDASLLKAEGFEGMNGFITGCAPVGPGKIGVRCIPGMDMILGTSCNPAKTIVTLKFSALTIINVESALSLSSIAVNAPAGYLGMQTAPAQDITVDLNAGSFPVTTHYEGKWQNGLKEVDVETGGRLALHAAYFTGDADSPTGNISSASAAVATGRRIAFQWYKSATRSYSGTAIPHAMGNDYIPNTSAAGVSHYYAELIYTPNTATPTVTQNYFSDIITVTVDPLSSFPASLLTPAETSGWTRTTSSAEVAAFCQDVAAASGGRIRVSSIGLTGGRKTPGLLSQPQDIPLLIIGKPAPASPAQVPDDKAIVLINAGIHSGEVEGKESMLIFAREAALGLHDGLLEDLVILLIPNFNADGNDYLFKQRIGTQYTPKLVGSRFTGAAVNPYITGNYNATSESHNWYNINRDMTKLDSLEGTGVVALMNEWDPVIFVDLHATNGSLMRHSVTYNWGLHPNTDAAIMEYNMNEFSDKAVGKDSYLYNVQGKTTQPYGNFSGGSLEAGTTRWNSFEDYPRYTTNYAGLRNRLALLTEVYSHDPYTVRVDTQYACAYGVLQTVAEDKVKIKQLLAAADQRALDRATAGLNPQVDFVALNSNMQKLKDITVETYVASATGASPLSQSLTDDENDRCGTVYAGIKEYTIPYYGNWTPTEKMPMGAYYLLDIDCDAAVALLLKHGIEVSVLDAPVTVSAANFQWFRGTRRAQSATGSVYEGHLRNNFVGTWETPAAAQVFPAGTYVVSTAQPLGSLAALLLEPTAVDGAVTWNFFDNQLAPFIPVTVRSNYYFVTTDTGSPTYAMPIFKLTSYDALTAGAAQPSGLPVLLDLTDSSDLVEVTDGDLLEVDDGRDPF